jgi:serine/threonine protein kinase
MAARSLVDWGAPAEHGATPAAGTRLLADVLASGPLPLPVALAYAKEIASGAAVFHRGGRAYGALRPARITVGPRGPILPRPNGMSHLATQSSDLRDFGLLLHQMLTGLDPADYSPPASTDDVSKPSPEMVRSAALRLVQRCCCAPGQSDLRHVSTELRLLQVMVNSLGPDEMVGPPPEDRPVEQPAIPAAPARPAESSDRRSGCPSCGSPAYFPAHRLTLLEKLLAVVDWKTYRCYGCCQRFIDVFGLRVPRPESS